MCVILTIPTGALYICTEDVFPNRRLVQMVEMLKLTGGPELRKIEFMDNIFIEHAGEVVSCS